MRDVSVLIAARNEMFLPNTIEDVLKHSEADTEIVVVLDGYKPSMPDNPRVRPIYHDEPIGQRAGINEAATYSEGRFVMKLDAHCSVDQGFDVKLMADCEKDWTVIPRMYRFHVFDWVCPQCEQKYYQADKPDKCRCGSDRFEMKMVWEPRWEKEPTDFGRFDNNLHWQYWRKYHRRPEAKSDIADVMSSIGACFFMHRERFFELDGLDEKHGFWGQFGTEISCKSWLSGGRQVVNKKTWFAHFFRVGRLKFPYSISGEAQERARVYSRQFWFGNKWEKAKRPLKWLIDRFAPVPDWKGYDWSQVQ